MNVKSTLMIGANVIIVGSMVGIFAFHMNAEKERMDALAAEIEKTVEAVNDATERAEKLAKEATLHAAYQKQLECLATNIYHEANVEGDEGKRAVAWTTLNRVVDEKYPNTICEVVYQANLDERGEPIRNECQFSWYCDGKSDEIKSLSAWNRALKIAQEVLMEYDVKADPTDGAIMYHADYVNPFWAEAYERTVQIETHIFYR